MGMGFIKTLTDPEIRAKSIKDKSFHFLIIKIASASTFAIFIIMATLANAMPQQFGGLFFGLLYNPQIGVYLDCSKSENRKNPVCESKNSRKGASDFSEMRKVKNFQAFSLNKK